jgi:hypothetical protein
MFEFCGEEVDVHEELAKISKAAQSGQAGETPTATGPAEQRDLDRQEAEEKPVDPNITGCQELDPR